MLSIFSFAWESKTKETDNSFVVELFLAVVLLFGDLLTMLNALTKELVTDSK